MRYLLVLAFVAMACASSITPQQTSVLRYLSEKFEGIAYSFDEKEGEIDFMGGSEGNEEIAPAFVLSWQVRRFIRKFQKEMPCGFPQYGVPPLAPLKVREGEISLKKGILETFDKVFKLRVDGLDAFKIKKFKLNLIFNRITFDFLFTNIVTSAEKYDTDTIVDVMRQLGLSVEYEGDGTVDFGLKNLRVAGTLKYKIPILWGSIKITSLKTTISLDKCTSDITGLLGDGSLNRMINRQLETVVEDGINNNQAAISDMIEDNLVPKVNKMLKGNDFWTLIDLIFSSSEGEKEDDPIVTKCVPPTDPWA